MSVSAVYELPEGSPRWCVRIRSKKHVAVHRFYDKADAEDFRERAYAAPDAVDAALIEANEALASGEPHPCIDALAGLTAAVEAQQMVEGRA